MQTTSKYPLSLRLVHWITVLLLLALVILGFWMTDRSAANIWDELTNTLYAWHKALGFAALIIVGVRLAIRARTQPVSDNATLPPIQRTLIKLVDLSTLAWMGWGHCLPSANHLGWIQLTGHARSACGPTLGKTIARDTWHSCDGVDCFSDWPHAGRT